MADNEEEVSIEELQASLTSHQAQLKHVEGLLALDPGNAEYEEVRRGLQEVIGITVDLLSSAQQAGAEGFEELSAYNSTVLDAHSNAQQVPAVAGEISDGLAIGTKVQAVWSEDGEWYDGTIEAITPFGYLISYDGWGNKEEVDFENVREVLNDVGNAEGSTLLRAEEEAEATRLAIKRKIAESAGVEVLPRGLPPKLRIQPEDPEDVRAAKKKKIHAFKSRMRFEQLEIAQNKRQNAWQQFQSSKSSSKKVGFFTGRKRESIFKSPDDPNGKVGVTGSGKGITEFQKREKYVNLKVGNEEGED